MPSELSKYEEITGETIPETINMMSTPYGMKNTMMYAATTMSTVPITPHNSNTYYILMYPDSINMTISFIMLVLQRIP